MSFCLGYLAKLGGLGRLRWILQWSCFMKWGKSLLGILFPVQPYHFLSPRQAFFVPERKKRTNEPHFRHFGAPE